MEDILFYLEEDILCNMKAVTYCLAENSINCGCYRVNCAFITSKKVV